VLRLPRRAALSLLSQWRCCVCFVTFFTWISLQPSLWSWTWLHYKKGNSTQNSTVYHAYGNTVNFWHTSRMHFLASLRLLKPMYAQMPKNARNHARNRPFLLRHVDFHLTRECLGPPHSPRQTTARSLYALPRNDATNSPLVTMGRRKFTPPKKLPLPLRRSPPKSNTPIPSPTPLTTPNGIRIFCHNTDVRTDKRGTTWSITIALCWAILIASDALKSNTKCMVLGHCYIYLSHYCRCQD